ncbi:hypothetical protein DD237_000968 [Peronospora effusa]|uniref:Uncharacterized protein n=1 Tax=Peronospora effusa TaxID=542832 RepID=A0A3R7XSF4_9STRA|nr:hypothetical protein DD237_000968 [Peronospora effusa]
MTSTVSNELLQFCACYKDNHTPRFVPQVDNHGEVLSSSVTDLSNDSTLTKDDLVFLSDLFGVANPTTNVSSVKLKQVTSTQPHSRKRPRSTKGVSETGRVLPKSQQQRQKLEIEFLRKQVVELQARIEELRARKMERKRQKLQGALNDTSPALNLWVNSTNSHVIAVQQLEEQNEKLRSQVTAYLGELKQFEHIARTQYLANDVLEPMHFTGHPATNYYSTSY